MDATFVMASIEDGRGRTPMMLHPDHVGLSGLIPWLRDLRLLEARRGGSLTARVRLAAGSANDGPGEASGLGATILGCVDYVVMIDHASGGYLRRVKNPAPATPSFAEVDYSELLGEARVTEIQLADNGCTLRDAMGMVTRDAALRARADGNLLQVVIRCTDADVDAGLLGADVVAHHLLRSVMTEADRVTIRASPLRRERHLKDPCGNLALRYQALDVPVPPRTGRAPSAAPATSQPPSKDEAASHVDQRNAVMYDMMREAWMSDVLDGASLSKADEAIVRAGMARVKSIGHNELYWVLARRQMDIIVAACERHGVEWILKGAR